MIKMQRWQWSYLYMIHGYRVFRLGLMGRLSMNYNEVRLIIVKWRKSPSVIPSRSLLLSPRSPKAAISNNSRVASKRACAHNPKTNHHSESSQLTKQAVNLKSPKIHKRDQDLRPKQIRRPRHLFRSFYKATDEINSNVRVEQNTEKREEL